MISGKILFLCYSATKECPQRRKVVIVDRPPYSSRARLLGYAGPEGGALGEEFVVAHVVRSVTGKSQANHAVENIEGGRA